MCPSPSLPTNFTFFQSFEHLTSKEVTKSKSFFFFDGILPFQSNAFNRPTSMKKNALEVLI